MKFQICLFIICLILVPSNILAILSEYKVLATDGAAGDTFGRSVSISGDMAIVGVTADDVNGSDSGSAYIFTRTDGTWTQTQKLIASDGAVDDSFGCSVSISGDMAIVGAYLDDDNGSSSGSAYIFTKTNGTWSETVKLIASDGAASDLFGCSVSISGDTAIVGAYDDDDYGSSSGSAYIFTKTAGIWAQTDKLTASDEAADDFFGKSVSMSGDMAIIGAYGDDEHGDSSGSAYIFTKTGDIWTQTDKLTVSDGAAGDSFGNSVSISGDMAIVGAHRGNDWGDWSGSVYIFTKTGGVWAETDKLIASDGAAYDQFGFSVSISGDVAIVGAHGDDDNGSFSGSAYIFTNANGIWSETEKLTPSDGAADDNYGFSVSISVSTAIVGADGDDDAGSVSGSAYCYLGNLPPVAVADFSVTIEDSFINITALANDTDYEDDPISLQSVESLSVNGAVISANPDSTIKYDPTQSDTLQALAEGETLSDSFVYTIVDGHNPAVTGTVTVTVNGVNDAPIAVADNGSTFENIPLNLNLHSNDTDVDSNAVLSVSFVVNPSNKGAIVTRNTDGTVSYDPTASTTLDALESGESVQDTFQYIVTDQYGLTDTGTVTITVSGVNDAPVAVADSASTFENIPLNLNLHSNDIDVDNNAILSVDSVESPSSLGVIVTINTDGTVSYDPTESATLNALGVGESVLDTFQYIVTDQYSLTHTGTVTVTVNGVNDAPIAVADNGSTFENIPLNLNLHSNDTSVI